MTTTIKQHINSLPLDERADFVKDYNELQTELKQLNNMTKVSVFGQQSTEQPKELKKIEFVARLLTVNDLKVVSANLTPSMFDNVSLFCKSEDDDLDIILAWDNEGPRDERNVFLGHWNDGVI